MVETTTKKKLFKTAAIVAGMGASLYVGSLIRKPEPVVIIRQQPPVTRVEKHAHVHRKAHPVYRESENREPEEKRVTPPQREQAREPQPRYAEEQPRQYEQVAQVQEPCTTVQTSTYNGGWGGAGSSVSTQGVVCGKTQKVLEKQTIQANQNGINNANEMSKAQIRQQNAIAMQQMAVAAQQGAWAVRNIRNALRRY